MYEKLELILIERSSQTEDANKQKINPKLISENKFILGQFYFEYVSENHLFEIFIHNLKNWPILLTLPITFDYHRKIDISTAV